ncbi:MAG: hypothetical protein EZS28_024275, partial [Streblomastix strix]
PAPVGVQEKLKQRKGSKNSKTEGLSASDKPSQSSNAQAQTKTTSKVPKPKVAIKKRVNRSIVADRARTLQPREISVEISLWDRKEERADDNGSSGDGGNDWRIDIQRERQWNGKKDQKIYINMKTDKKRRLLKRYVLSEIQRLKQLIEIRRKQNDNPIQRNIRREGSLPRYVEGSIGRRNSHTNLIRQSEMVEPYIPYKETQWNMEKDSGCEQVVQGNREIILQNAWTRGTFNFYYNNYSFNVMSFGTKHSSIFFAEAIESILRQIRIHSEIKILNYCDDILLIHQDKQTLKTQTMKILKTLEQFGWTISTEKCEIEPKQVITFLEWIWNLKEINIRMSDERKLKLIQTLKDMCNVIYKNKSIKIRQLAVLISRLNFLRPQIKETSLYLIELDKAKTQALKTKSWDGIMIVKRTVIRELK